ncbi:MAG: helix-turn-helix transcriptional regulator [Bacteroidia bacterium]|nr:helix-turn-helix transcriptional regulator [Bacteroidia bacterium]
MTENKLTSFGEYVRQLRLDAGLPLRKIAAQLDIDPSLLGKIERNERRPTKVLVIAIAKVFKQNPKDLYSEFISDQFAYKILEDDVNISALKVAEEKVLYIIKSKKKK